MSKQDFFERILMQLLMSGFQMDDAIAQAKKALAEWEALAA